MNSGKNYKAREVQVAQPLMGAGPVGGNQGGDFVVQVIPILEAGARTGNSTTDVRAGIGIGQDGDPMFTLQSGKQHAVAMSVAIRGRDGGATAELGGEAAYALRAADGGGSDPYVLAFSCKDYGADTTTDIAPTMRAMGHNGSHANAGGQLAICIHGTQDPDILIDLAHTLGRNSGQENALAAQPGMKQQTFLATTMAVRRLMPIECHRLQGFPDDHCAVPINGKIAADGPQYKQLGNSWAVNHARWAGGRLNAVLRATPRRRPILDVAFDDHLLIWALVE